jgi:hypothetical protein
MLVQINEDEWLESGEIQYIKPKSYWVWPNGDTRWHGFFDPEALKEAESIGARERVGTRIETRNDKGYYSPCHPQRFMDYLEEVGVVFVRGTKFIEPYD